MGKTHTRRVTGDSRHRGETPESERETNSEKDKGQGAGGPRGREDEGGREGKRGEKRVRQGRAGLRPRRRSAPPLPGEERGASSGAAAPLPPKPQGQGGGAVLPFTSSSPLSSPPPRVLPTSAAFLIMQHTADPPCTKRDCQPRDPGGPATRVSLMAFFPAPRTHSQP